MAPFAWSVEPLIRSLSMFVPLVKWGERTATERKGSVTFLLFGMERQLRFGTLLGLASSPSEDFFLQIKTGRFTCAAGCRSYCLCHLLLPPAGRQEGPWL